MKEKDNQFDLFTNAFVFKTMPIHFVSFSLNNNEIVEIKIITKQNIYDCKIHSETDLIYDENWSGNKDYYLNNIYQYITGTCQYGLIILPYIPKSEIYTTKTNELKQMIEKVFKNQKDSFFCIHYLEFIEKLYKVHKIEYKQFEIFDFVNHHELAEMIQPCQDHCNKPEGCFIGKCHYHLSGIQTLLNQKGIQLQNIN